MTLGPPDVSPTKQINNLRAKRVSTMKRRKMSKKKSRKLFSRTGSKVHKKNMPRSVMRGGIRL